MGIPVYTFTGFLEAGKTKFIQETLEDERFNAGERTLVLVMGLIFLVSSMFISTLEGLPYVDCAFEVASAMGTVGLTTGITPTLSMFSQSLLILLMYTGRVGLLSFSIALAVRHGRPAKLRYPEMSVMIG